LGRKSILVLSSATLIYLCTISSLVISFASKSYVINNSELYKIDSVKMLDRAFYLTASKSSSKSGIEFEDLKYKTFRIEGSSWNALREKKNLYDTMQYSSLIMTIYTDKQGYNNYVNKNDDSKIKVFGLKIANKDFINLDDVNVDAKGRIFFIIIILSVLYLLFILLYLNNRIAE
jgi:hypothetical protein